MLLQATDAQQITDRTYVRTAQLQRFFDGLTQSEIATRLKLPLGTVKSFMRRGLIKVREYMNIDAEGVLSEG